MHWTCVGVNSLLSGLLRVEYDHSKAVVSVPEPPTLREVWNAAVSSKLHVKPSDAKNLLLVVLSIGLDMFGDDDDDGNGKDIFDF